MQDFALGRAIILEPEPQQQRTERQPLQHERA
jgi:hypothetical protein